MTGRANQDIRMEANKAGVKLWQIADALGITDNWFSRVLRKELPDEKKSEIRNIIARLTEKAGA